LFFTVCCIRSTLRRFDANNVFIKRLKSDVLKTVSRRLISLRTDLYSTQRGLRMTPLPGPQSVFHLVWPWPLTLWPPKLTISCPCHVDHLAPKLVNSFSKRRILNPLDLLSWYTGCWWVGFYIWYCEQRLGRAVAPPSTLRAVPNVTAHPLTASVPITVLL